MKNFKFGINIECSKGRGSVFQLVKNRLINPFTRKKESCYILTPVTRAFSNLSDTNTC